MNLLPSLDELIPIINENNVFYECNFNTNFNILSLKRKLQVLCDLVRQSIYPNGFPNPDNDIFEMNGNCYTAAFCLSKYLNELNIGRNVRCALARKRIFDVDEITTTHVVVLVDSDDGHIYQLDPTPFPGYKYGSVDDVTYKKIYEEYVVIDYSINELLYSFRKIIYEDSLHKFNRSKIHCCLELCNSIHEFPILKGYAATVLKIVKKYIDTEYEKNKIQELINSIKPYNKINTEKMIELKNKMQVYFNEWVQELRDLQHSDTDIKRQSELAIAITQERKWIDDSYEKFILINGKKTRISCVNPRFLYESHYNTIFCDSSQSKGLLSSVIKNKLLISGYDVNLNLSAGDLRIVPITFFRLNNKINFNIIPDIISVLLLDSNSDNINLLNNRQINNTFFDDFSQDSVCNYSEQSLRFLIGYPEHQVMTKFMYPNPKLVKKIN